MIGHGMVGHKFIEAILEKADDELEITILAEEPRIAYDRVHLTEYFSGKSAKDLSLARFDFADAHAAQTVTTNHGDVISYDKLVLATGSYAFVPPIPGNDRETASFTVRLKT
uniref:FAD/NAD(P)-binding domain-containing protein n=1 Tax=Ditylenchus dipsaci TaxID=166011 RepID=A0A915DXG5_9BILA